jgi:hypothetical protein
VYVQTWYRRDTGWFGHALRSRRARIRVPGLEADVTIEDIGDASTQVTTNVDAAYRTKYGGEGASSMVTATAAATTLQLNHEWQPGAEGVRRSGGVVRLVHPAKG